MGCVTEFKLKIKRSKVRLEDQPIVKDIQDHLDLIGHPLGVDHIAGLIRALPNYFNTGDESDAAILSRLEDISGYTWDEFDNSMSGRWYSRAKDMAALSEYYPTIVFELRGDGEEQGDVWKEEWQNGKKVKEQRAKLVFDDGEEVG